MKHFLLGIIVVLLASSAFADAKQPAISDDGAVMTSFCEAADCGSLPTVETNPAAPWNAYSLCTKARDYTSCILRCDCGYEANKKRCKSSPTCINLALSERNACYGNCSLDFMF